MIRNIDISDPSVDPVLLFESFCWWFAKQFRAGGKRFAENFFVDGRGHKGVVGGEGINLSSFVSHVGLWSKSSVGAWRSQEWEDSVGGARVLVECWSQLGLLRVVGEGVWFLEFRPRCDSDIKSKGGVL
jgi:hypothetical protein